MDLKHKYSSGFTLIEISIVVIVIGIILAATLTGKEIIKAAELRSMVAVVEEYKAALSQFEQLYEAIPGDMANATSYWATATNGDGDLTINIETSDEPFSAFEQLALADFIDGTFTGAWGTGFVLDSNIKGLQRQGAGVYIKCCSGTDYSRTLNFNNHVNLFSVYSADDDFRAGIISPVEARNIDNKLDDGIPDYGFVGGSGSYTGTDYEATGCYSGTGSTSVYLSADATYKDAESCQMLFAYDWD